MKPASVITALFLFSVPALFAAEIPAAGGTPADTTTAYVVRTGDTLWDISEARLGDPYSWKKIWERNRFVRNPDLIFPGQILLLGLMPSAPQMPSAPAAPAPESPQQIEPAPQPFLDEPSALVPRALPRDTANVLQLLRAPRPVFTVTNHMRTGFIAKRSEIPRARILRLEDAVIGAVRHDMLVTDLATGVKPGDLLAVVVDGNRVKHPLTGRDYGFVVRVKGMLRVESVRDGQSRCMVTETFDPIEAGDLVMPYTPGGGALFDAWVRPGAQIEGVILAVADPMISIHTDDILYIDKGERDGVRPGDRFTIFRRQKPGGQDARIPLGLVEAVTVMPGETAVIVTSLADENIVVGDRVELSARCRIVGK